MRNPMDLFHNKGRMLNLGMEKKDAQFITTTDHSGGREAKKNSAAGLCLLLKIYNRMKGKKSREGNINQGTGLTVKKS